MTASELNKTFLMSNKGYRATQVKMHPHTWGRLCVYHESVSPWFLDNNRFYSYIVLKDWDMKQDEFIFL